MLCSFQSANARRQRLITHIHSCLSRCLKCKFIRASPFYIILSYFIKIIYIIFSLY